MRGVRGTGMARLGTAVAVAIVSLGWLGPPGHASGRSAFHLDRAQPAPVAGHARNAAASRQLRRRGYLVPRLDG